MNKLLTSFVVVIISGIIIFVSGCTQSYLTYNDKFVSFQYPEGWNVTKEKTNVLVYVLNSSDQSIIIYERNSSEIPLPDTVQANNYSNNGKVITEYYGRVRTYPKDTTFYVVQTGGKIFSVTGETSVKDISKHIADTLIVKG